MISGQESLWTESMLWDKQVTISSGIGYRDNIFLSPFAPRASAFFVNGLDLTVLRMPLDGWKIVGLITGEEMQYWRNLGTNSEYSLLASLRLERELPHGWQAALEWQGIAEKQVLDATTSRAAPVTALVEGYGLSGDPSVRKDFQNGLWCQVELPLRRWSLQSPLDDYWEFGPMATMGDNVTKFSDLAFSYGASYQPYDSWVALDPYGRRLPRHLEVFQDRAELAWHQYWDAHKHLRSATRVVFAYDEDNGGGYFNYYQYQIVEDLLWQTKNWQIKGSAQQVYELYPVEGVGILNGQHLDRNFLNLSLDAERRIFKGLKGFAAVAYQRGHSNYAAEAGDYTARTFSCGLRWGF
jgi:hypothetical protein